MRNPGLALAQRSAGSATQLSISSAPYCPWCLVTSDRFIKMVFHHECSGRFYECPNCKSTMGAD